MNDFKRVFSFLQCFKKFRGQSFMYKTKARRHNSKFILSLAKKASFKCFSLIPPIIHISGSSENHKFTGFKKKKKKIAKNIY